MGNATIVDDRGASGVKESSRTNSVSQRVAYRWPPGHFNAPRRQDNCLRAEKIMRSSDNARSGIGTRRSDAGCPECNRREQRQHGAWSSRASIEQRRRRGATSSDASRFACTRNERRCTRNGTRHQNAEVIDSNPAIRRQFPSVVEHRQSRPSGSHPRAHTGGRCIQRAKTLRSMLGRPTAVTPTPERRACVEIVCRRNPIGRSSTGPHEL